MIIRLLLILLFCGSVWGHGFKMEWDEDGKVSTITVTNYPDGVEISSNALILFEGNKSINHPENEPKIEWECYERKKLTGRSAKDRIHVGFDAPCIRWIGFREDNMVIWKKEE